MNIVKRISAGLLLIVVLGIFSCQDPTSATSDVTIIVSGQVLNLSNAPQDSVVITLGNPFRRDTTKTDGTFSYSFVTSSKEEVSTTMSFRHINLSFRDTSLSVSYGPAKKTIAVGEMKMKGVSAAQDSIPPTKASTRPVVITFVRSTSPLISIRGAGNDATNLTFEVRDSLGIPVDQKNQVTVFFKIVAEPDNLVELGRPSAPTNSVGQVTVRLSSGQKAGIAQVQATSIVKNVADTTKMDTLKSPIVSVTIAGGLPVESRFTIGSQKVNVPGLVKYDLRNTITAVVGDTFGNPVQKGTVVYFSTTGGIIKPYATTTEDGTVGIDLITGNPAPSNGIAVVTAQVGTPGSATPGNNVVMNESVVIKGLKSKKTQKESDAALLSKSNKSSSGFTKQLNILFSGAPLITSNDSAYFSVPPLGTKQIQVRVADFNGNPMAEGTTVKISGIGLDTSGAVLSGDLDKVLPDTYDKSYTLYNISVADKRTKNLSSRVPISIIVEVNGPNGNVKRTLFGELASGVSDSGKVGSINLVSSSIDSIVVSGAGSPNAINIQARVLTSTGGPSSNIPVNFSIVKSVNGGEYISNSIAYTNASGVATTTLNAGVRSGLVQVQASVRRDSLSMNAELKSVYIRTGKTAAITVVGLSSTSLSVKGGGGNENAIIVYEAQDSLGNPVDISNQSTISFSMVGDTAGAKISPASAKTDPNSGRVTASFSSGTKAGIVQIKASTGSIVSPPATITISGGFAVDSLFNFTGLKKNYSIYQASNILIDVLAGDKSGNPVKPSTPIYFTTDAGVISATSLTDNAGRATATLQIVNDKKLMGRRFVTAKTVGEGNAEIKKTKTFILSGTPTITTSVPNDSITLFDGTSTTVNFLIADSLGNPISSGHTYLVFVDGSVSSQIGITGDRTGTVEDSDDNLNGVQYSVVISDLLENAGTGGTFKLRIQTNGPTGTTTKTINGRLLAPANIIVPPSARVPASIALTGVSSNDISIAGVGGTENSTLTFEVRDSVGSPITIENRARVSFKTNFSPNTFTLGGTNPVILPTLDSTDENGKVRVSITSGTQAGVLQLEAVINLTNPVRTIKSQPVIISVSSGFADQGHFTIAPSQYNFPGLQKAFLSMNISVQVGDRYSNPVKQGTSVYFNSANGIIQTQKGLTDINGFVTMTLFSGNPYPLSPNLASGLSNGFSRLYARTIGKDSAFVTDSVEILWSGSPIITKTDTINSFTIPNAGSAGPFTFTVQDYLGHPMSQGTTIEIEANGLSISGNSNVTMPDTKSSGPGLTSFTFAVTDANTTDSDPPSPTLITIVVRHPVYGVYKLVTASGTVD